jgi:hypothetical protein
VKLTDLMFFSLLVAGTAVAAHTEHYTATEAEPLGAEKVVVANGNIWRCSGTTCVLASQPKVGGSMRTCRELKRQVGALTAYGSADDTYDSAKLSKCNGGG